MPFNVNNVDLSVNTNALFGLNMFLQEGDKVEQIFDEKLRQMMVNTTNFIKWGIESETIISRPELALTYYPSIFDFYWFVARLYNFLNNEGGKLKFKEQIYCRDQLKLTLQN